MTIRFDCPNCKANYDVADDLGGKMIMCRVCKKRGSVKSLAAAGAATASASGQKSLALSPSRRKFLMLGIPFTLASLAAIATGAALAIRPWRQPIEPTNTGRRRGPGGPPPPDGAPPPDKGGAPPDKVVPKGPV